MQQQTDEWHKLRNKMIGASDAPIIMEVSPWTTPYQLWERKLEITPNPKQSQAMERGLRLESDARESLNNLLGVNLNPAVIISQKEKFMMASMDAISKDGNFAVEIKCPNPDGEDHQKALSGEIPEKYFPQLQHQIFVCGLKDIIYCSFDGENCKLITCKKDDRYIKQMIEKEREFYECLMNLEPPSLNEKDFIQRTDENWGMLAQQWKTLQNSKKELEEQEKKLKQELLLCSSQQNSSGFGIKVQKIVRKGNIDYSQIEELKKIDLEKYRKPYTEYWKIS